MYIMGTGMTTSDNHTPNEPLDVITGVPDSDYDYAYTPTGEGPRKRKNREAPQPRRRKRGSCLPCGLWALIGCMGMCCLCCIAPICALGTAAGGIAAVASNSEVTGTDTQTLTIDPDSPVTLTIDNPVGSVVVSRGGSDTVEITSTRRAFGWNTERATRELDNITVEIDQPETNEIAVKVDTTRATNTVWSRANNVEMTVRVPDNASLTIKNNLGSIVVRGVLVSALDLQTTLGSITFDGELAPDSAATYFIETGTGAVIVQLPTAVYADIDARAGVGNVTVSAMFERVTVDTELNENGEMWWTGTLGSGSDDPPTLTLRSNTGAITVEPQ